MRTGCWHGCCWMPLCPQQFGHIQAHMSLAARCCDGESQSDRQTDEDTISAHMTTSDAWMDTFDMHNRSRLPDLGVDLHAVRLRKCIHLLLLHANVALQPEAAPSSTHLIGWQSEWTRTHTHSPQHKRHEASQHHSRSLHIADLATDNNLQQCTHA